MARSRTVSYADIEHVEHQIAVLRDQLLQLKVRAMFAGGWKQVEGKDYKGRPLVRWKDPRTGCGPLSCGRVRAILRE